MRIPALAALALASLPLCTEAGEPGLGLSKDEKNPIFGPRYNDNELLLDVFSAYSNYEGSNGYGGGLGITYYFHHYFAFGLDATYVDADHGGWTSSAYLVGRYPFEINHIGWCLYGKAAFGITDHETRAGFFGVGGGMEMRFSPRWGFYGEGMANFAAADEDFVQARFGLRFVF